MNSYRRTNLPTVFLYPGEIHISDKPTQIITTLGSCVSVTMFNHRSNIGAICHGALPRCRTNGDCRSPCIEAFKFTDCAVTYMLNRFKLLGIENKDIEVKIFGGADTLMSRSSNSIGTQNVKTALHILGKAKLRVIAADVGDSFGRKLVFFSHTGEAFLKRLKNGNHHSAINEQKNKSSDHR